MSLEGRIHEGTVVFDQPVQLVDGTRVRVEPLEGAAVGDGQGSSLLEQLGDVIDAIEGLPDDLGVNLDYYLHGIPRKQQPRSARWIEAGEPVELTEEETASEANQLLSMAAETGGLPPDLSTNHDHYLHCLPKQ